MNAYTDTQKIVKKFDSIPETKDIKKDGASFTDTAQSITQNVKEATAEGVEEATKTVESGVNYAKKEGEKTFCNVENFVKENPAKGLAYALGIGAVLAYFMLPRR